MKYSEFEALRADRVVVFDLIEHLRQAFEEFCNTYHKDVPFKDVFMGVHNFHKLIVVNIVDQCEMPIEEARLFLQMSVYTYQKSVDDFIERRRTAEREDRG